MAEVLGAVASVATLLELSTKVSGYLIGVKDARNDRNRIQQELSAMTGILYCLQNQAPHLEMDSDVFSTFAALGLPNGPLTHFETSLRLLESKLTMAKGVRGVGKSISWPFKKDEVMDILSSLERQKASFNLALQNDHIKLSRKIRHEVAEINEKLEVMNEKFSQIRMDQQMNEKAQRRRNILNWLSPLTFRSQQLDLLTRSQPGAGEWFLKSPEFETWRDSPAVVLHCQGIPGAGKTFLASKVAEHLTSYYQQRHVAIVYVYCSYQETKLQTLENCLGSMLEQMAEKLDNLPSELYSLYETQSARNIKPTLQELGDLLNVTIALFQRTFLVLDALDEYGDISAMLETLEQMRSTGINMLITSRPSISLHRNFPDSTTVMIRAHDDDLREYLEGRMPRLHCIKARPEIKALVEDSIIKAADGMFLLARLHFDSLIDRASPKAIKIALHEIPKGAEALPLVYDSVMNRIYSQSKWSSKQAIKILIWLFYAKRPLTVLELQRAVAIEIGSEVFDVDNVTDVDSLVALCQGLVSVQTESQSVHLAHYTTQKYFEDTKARHFPNGEANVALACLTYLAYHFPNKNICDFGNEQSGSSIFVDSNDGQYVVSKARYNTYDLSEVIALGGFTSALPLSTYAATNWGKHALNVQHAVKEVALKFLSTRYNVAKAARDMDDAPNPLELRFRSKDLTQSKVQGIHLCAYFNLDYLLMLLVDGGANLYARDEVGQTPLIWAASANSLAVIQRILTLPYHSGSTPVHNHLITSSSSSPNSLGTDSGDNDDLASPTREVAMPVNASDIEQNTPLAVAVERGHVNAVSLLLSKPYIKPDLRCRRKTTPLMRAAAKGFYDIVELLLARDDVDVLVKDEHNYSILDSAIMCPCFDRGGGMHLDLVRLLLARKEILNLLSETKGRKTLQIATRYSTVPILQALLSIDEVDVNSKDFEGRNALSYAASFDDETIMLLLLSFENIQLNSKDRLGRPALYYAAVTNSEDNVRLLLSKSDIEPNVQDIFGGFICYVGPEGKPNSKVQIHLSGVKLRVFVEDVGVDMPSILRTFNAARRGDHWGRDEGFEMFSDGSYGYRVDKCLFSRSTRILELFLEHPEVDPSSRDNDGRSMLDYALFYCQYLNIRRLLSEERVRSSVQRYVGDDSYISVKDVCPEHLDLTREEGYIIKRFTLAGDKFELEYHDATTLRNAVVYR